MKRQRQARAAGAAPSTAANLSSSTIADFVHPVGHRLPCRLMRHRQHRQAMVATQPLDLGTDLRFGVGIKASGGLVEDQQPGW